jgi:uncharacterized membrane protein (UPF0127 family)
VRVTVLDTFTIHEPTTRRERARGLLGRAALGPDHALLLRRCRSVHTFGMRFAIDVVLLDGTWRTLAVVRMPPGRLLRPRRRVRHVLEVAAGRGAAAAHEIHWPVPGALPVDTQPPSRSSST